ncbi:hypothetical protein PF001_g13284 [Phytophthora fragariae]|uniref:Uncharacterized protein n=1 Tax=Phytophthora fragariae TaxID=53985 RepID=A0A6A4DD67_9STRA|nr:hypothetical protein PF001_g13284 [Phytophthora fragariae]
MSARAIIVHPTASSIACNVSSTVTTAALLVAARSSPVPTSVVVPRGPSAPP